MMNIIPSKMECAQNDRQLNKFVGHDATNSDGRQNDVDHSDGRHSTIQNEDR